jgi:isovaleryl-CoA dehydrogenase
MSACTRPVVVVDDEGLSFTKLPSARLIDADVPFSDGSNGNPVINQSLFPHPVWLVKRPFSRSPSLPDLEVPLPRLSLTEKDEAKPETVQSERLRTTAAKIALEVLEPQAERIDREGLWPKEGLNALGKAGLLGLHVPKSSGGLDEGLLTLAIVSEELGKACSSTAMCFSMHCVATKVIAAKATAYQREHFLRPIAEGRHITTLALSEAGTGAHFFLPRAQVRVEGDQYVVTGDKSFVTSGGHADSYVVSVVPPGSELDPGSFTCLAIDGRAPGLDWSNQWAGFGMRGNSSRPVQLNNVPVPRANLLGEEGDQIWYVFEVVAPYFIIAMAGVYLGIAQAAFDIAVAHLKGRRHSHSGETLSDQPVLADQVANMWIDLQSTRQLIHYAARQGDAGAPDAALALFASKADVAVMATKVTQAALELSGGRGYAENSKITRLIRDAQAANVMSPTTHLLKKWLGRSLLGLPPL